jgi:RimJ/RimL family protein N-acetyltransferase
MNDIIIKTPNFTLKTLNSSDNLDLYLSWMRNVTNNEFILTCCESYSLEELKLFIERNNSISETILLGIFENKTKKHIGNIKYSEINQLTNSARMGILIGQSEWRGKGVGQEVISSSVEWLKKQFSIKRVTLGVDIDNVAAINLYNKLGFIKVNRYAPKERSIIMELTL